MISERDNRPPAWAVVVVTALTLLFLSGCDKDDGQAGTAALSQRVRAEAFVLICPVFAAGAAIPKKHTGDGRDSSPELQWAGHPENTRELALIVDDPDAPSPEPWVHWVLYGIPGDSDGLRASVAPNGKSSAAQRPYHGVNSWGTIGYRGPKPPPGHGVHHYHFKLYALDRPLAATEHGLSKADLVAAMAGHILAETELVGTYQR